MVNGRDAAKAFGVKGGGLGQAEEQMRVQLAAVKEQVDAAQARLNKLYSGATKDEVNSAQARVDMAKAGMESVLAQISAAKRNTTCWQPGRAKSKSPRPRPPSRRPRPRSRRSTCRPTSSPFARPPTAPCSSATSNVGEVLSPGASVIVLGKLDTLQITVYLPEARLWPRQAGADGQRDGGLVPGRNV